MHGHEDANYEKLASAMCWLPSHAGLVSGLTLVTSDEKAPVPYALLELALRLCAEHAAQAVRTTEAPAAGSCRSTSNAVACTGSVLPNASPLTLRLRRVISASLPPPAVLRLLQSADLQCLEVGMISPDVPVTVCPGLASMQKLRRLDLRYREVSHTTRLPVDFASAVGQLQHLTHLTIGGLTPAGARFLPVSLKSLRLHSLRRNSSGSNDSRAVSADDHLVSLTHLAAPSSLMWRSHNGELCDVTLPVQPVKLEAAGKLGLVGPHNVPDVDIAISDDGDGWQVVQQLPAFPHTLRCDIDIPYVEMLSPEVFRGLGDALGALFNLTELSLSAQGLLHNLQHARVLQQLRKLPSLLGLSVCCDTLSGPDHQDVDVFSMLQLSVLTTLTKLALEVPGAGGLDDVAAAAVAVNLTRLRMLELRSPNMQTWAVLPAIARLTGLHSLGLSRCYDDYGDTDPLLTLSLLRQLTSLTLLTWLDLPCQHLCEEDRKQFSAGMPWLHCL